jgi:hypothetical protein
MHRKIPWFLCSKAASFSGLFAMMLAIGCGGEAQKPTAEVSGTVTVKGKVVPEGSVIFQAEDDGRTAAAAVKDGNYSTKTAPAGKVKVALMVVGADPVGGNPFMNKAQGMRPPETKSGEKTPEKHANKGGLRLEGRYNNPQTSGLETDLKAGQQNNYNITIP